MNTALGIILWVLFIAAVQWPVSLLLERNLRRTARRMAEMAGQEVEMLDSVVLVVEDLARYMPEKEEILDLTRVSLLMAQANLRDMRTGLLLEADKRPALLKLPTMIRLAARAIPRVFAERRQNRELRRRLDEMGEGEQ